MSDFENLAESVYEALDMASNIEANVVLDKEDSVNLRIAYAHLRLAFGHIEDIVKRQS